MGGVGLPRLVPHLGAKAGAQRQQSSGLDCPGRPWIGREGYGSLVALWLSWSAGDGFSWSRWGS